VRCGGSNLCRLLPIDGSYPLGHRPVRSFEALLYIFVKEVERKGGNRKKGSKKEGEKKEKNSKMH
jgi:hypothetical protein